MTWYVMSWGVTPLLPRDLESTMLIICIYISGVSVASCWRMTLEAASGQFIQQWPLQSRHIPVPFVHRNHNLVLYVREQHVSRVTQ